ncbi:hypothetical protein HK099_006867 [Clydaea vesicula]|uniref:Carboxymuconolactone decarboxylase-like domain-containing protein n=1 Tax=Clydaea vesicula TaxID=447962 RepID=A0AAD5XYB0_9FUNG|nr:hypothetical protein HK099_006867 [Clydaea vesicula]KAJ3389299.1 hypothetical protein HDU92_001112 [Lobulomyces angularis]
MYAGEIFVNFEMEQIDYKILNNLNNLPLQFENKLSAEKISLIVNAVLCSLNITNLILPFNLKTFELNFKSVDEKRIIIEKVKETFYKISCVVGFPKSINALEQLKVLIFDFESNIENVKIRNRTRVQQVQENITSSGLDLFKTVYGKNSTAVLKKLQASHVDLVETILYNYGLILSDMSMLSVIETEFVLIAALKVQGGMIEKQAFSHILGAVNVGASKVEVDSAVELIEKIKICLMPVIPSI